MKIDPFKSAAHLTAALIDHGLPESVAGEIARDAFEPKPVDRKLPFREAILRRLRIRCDDRNLESQAIGLVLSYAGEVEP